MLEGMNNFLEQACPVQYVGHVLQSYLVFTSLPSDLLPASSALVGVPCCDPGTSQVPFVLPLLKPCGGCPLSRPSAGLVVSHPPSSNTPLVFCLWAFCSAVFSAYNALPCVHSSRKPSRPLWVGGSTWSSLSPCSLLSKMRMLVPL